MGILCQLWRCTLVGGGIIGARNGANGGIVGLGAGNQLCVDYPRNPACGFPDQTSSWAICGSIAGGCVCYFGHCTFAGRPWVQLFTWPLWP
jgi:hypothetical protein